MSQGNWIALGLAVFEAGKVGSHFKSFYHFSSFSFRSLHVSSGPSCGLEWFYPFPLFPYFSAPFSHPKTLTFLYVVLASPNLLQSIEHGRFRGIEYHIDRVSFSRF